MPIDTTLGTSVTIFLFFFLSLSLTFLFALYILNGRICVCAGGFFCVS